MKDQTQLITAYQQILRRYQIDQYDADMYPGHDDAQCFLDGRENVHRFCLVSRDGPWAYAIPQFATLDAAKAMALAHLNSYEYPETPVAIHDLETGDCFKPDYEALPWNLAAIADQPVTDLTRALLTGGGEFFSTTGPGKSLQTSASN